MLRTTFSGNKDADIEEFLYTYVNVVVRGKSEEEKAESLFAYLSGDARMKYKNKFIIGWSLNESRRNFPKVCEWLVKEYAKEVELDELIRIAIEGHLDFDNLLESFVQLCDMSAKDGIIDQAKYGMLRKAAMVNNRIANHVLIKGPTNLQGMNNAIVQFVKNSETFQPKPRCSMEQGFKTMDLEICTERPANIGSAAIETVRDDMKGPETRFDNRMDLITSQLESLTLTIKKTQRDKLRKNEPVCSHCQKPGYFANRCPDNPYRNNISKKCDRIGHHENNRWTENVKKFRLAGAYNESKVETKLLYKNDLNVENEAVTLVNEIVPVNTTKRDMEGIIRSKRQRILEHVPTPEPMAEIQAGGITSRPALVPVPAKGSRNKTKGSRQKPVGLENVLGCVQKYDLSTELTAAPTGLTFRQLLRGDAEDAREDLKKVLRVSKGRRTAAAHALSHAPVVESLRLRTQTEGSG